MKPSQPEDVGAGSKVPVHPDALGKTQQQDQPNPFDPPGVSSSPEAGPPGKKPRWALASLMLGITPPCIFFLDTKLQGWNATQSPYIAIFVVSGVVIINVSAIVCGAKGIIQVILEAKGIKQDVPGENKVIGTESENRKATRNLHLSTFCIIVGLLGMILNLDRLLNSRQTILGFVIEAILNPLNWVGCFGIYYMTVTKSWYRFFHGSAVYSRDADTGVTSKTSRNRLFVKGMAITGMIMGGIQLVYTISILALLAFLMLAGLM